jgi:hypothetical protein
VYEEDEVAGNEPAGGVSMLKGICVDYTTFLILIISKDVAQYLV